MKSRMAGLETKLKDLEQKMKNIGCVNNAKELIRAIFTLGLACLMPNDTKKKLQNVQADVREEKAIMSGLLKRSDYFDGLLGAASTLVEAADEAMDMTKNFRQGLVHAHTSLVRDFTESDIEENMGDIDFANDYTEELLKIENELLTLSKHTSASALSTKHKLDNALTQIEAYMNDDA
jgi:hypothetical protein